MIWIKFWFPLLAYSAIIFFLSSLPAPTLQQVPFTLSDKLVHVVEFSILGVLLARALASLGRWNSWVVWVLSIVCCTLYGISDEFHQSFVPGREVSAYDALADSIGGMLGAAIYLIIRKRVILNVSH